MLRIIQSGSAAQAKRYYTEGLGREDYYVGAEELPGIWGGRGAERLGLAGEVKAEQFKRLCENQHPDGSGKLTARNKANRRVGYDFNFHCPKGVSVAYSVSGDELLIGAVQAAVQHTMERMEGEVETRVRVDGKNETRLTGNLTWASFLHKTARPVDGVPDPHLHVHSFVFNATFDDTESRWKAADLAETKRNAPFFEAIFHHQLEANVQALGYATEERGKRWDIKSVSPEVCARYSRRTKEIESLAEAKGVTDVEALSNLGAATRRSKKSSLSLRDVRQKWEERISAKERAEIIAKPSPVHEPDEGGAPRSESGAAGNPSKRGYSSRATKSAVTLALEHCFERKSVQTEAQLIAGALHFARGRSSEPQLTQEIRARDLIRSKDKNGRTLVTRKDILEEEQRLIKQSRKGRGKLRALRGQDQLPEGPTHDAVSHLLQSKDRVTLLDTTASLDIDEVLSRLARSYRRSIKHFSVSASGQEARRTSGTVAALLKNEKLQRAVRGGVIWVNEASRLGTKDAVALLELAEKKHCRIILAGDLKRHQTTHRGTAMHLLEEHGGFKTQRTEKGPSSSLEERSLKQLFAEGDVTGGFSMLERRGGIFEAPRDDWAAELAQRFRDPVKKKQSCVAVTASRKAARALAIQLREELKRLGVISSKERVFERMTRVQGSAAELKDAQLYEAGQVVQFRQHVKGFRAGERYTVMGRDSFGNVVARKGGFVEALPLKHSDRYEVYTSDEVKFSVGEHIRISRSGYAKSKTLLAEATGGSKRHRVVAGSTRRIAGFTLDGDIKLDSGVVIPKEFGHWEHGLCATSHELQGQRVDRVVLCAENSVGSEVLQVANASARKHLSVFTEDSVALSNSIWQSRQEQTASALYADAVKERSTDEAGRKQRTKDKEHHERER